MKTSQEDARGQILDDAAEVTQEKVRESPAVVALVAVTVRDQTVIANVLFPHVPTQIAIVPEILMYPIDRSRCHAILTSHHRGTAKYVVVHRAVMATVQL